MKNWKALILQSESLEWFLVENWTLLLIMLCVCNRFHYFLIRNSEQRLNLHKYQSQWSGMIFLGPIQLKRETWSSLIGLAVFGLGLGLGVPIIPTLYEPPQLEPAATTATSPRMGVKSWSKNLNNTTTSTVRKGVVDLEPWTSTSSKSLVFYCRPIRWWRGLGQTASM